MWNFYRDKTVELSVKILQKVPPFCVGLLWVWLCHSNSKPIAIRFETNCNNSQKCFLFLVKTLAAITILGKISISLYYWPWAKVYDILTFVHCKLRIFYRKITIKWFIVVHGRYTLLFLPQPNNVFCQNMMPKKAKGWPKIMIPQYNYKTIEKSCSYSDVSICPKQL